MPISVVMCQKGEGLERRGGLTVKSSRERSKQDGIYDNASMRHIDKLPTTCHWFEVGLVYVVGEDTADSDIFGGRSRSHRHKNKKQRSSGTTFTQEGYSSVRKYKAGSHVCVWHSVGEGREGGIGF